MLQPVFVTGNISFELEGRRLEFLQQNISQTGVNGLPWGDLKATEHFGARVRCEVELAGIEGTAFSTDAHIVREYTLTTETMGVKFDLPAAQQKSVNELIRKHGHPSTEIVRKYPRIPLNKTIQTYPTHAVVAAIGSTTLVLNEQYLVFDVMNLSPNGALLSTENQLALMMQAGEKIDVTLQPRGWFPTQVKTQAQIVHVSDDIDQRSGNLVRAIGVRFGKMDELNKTAFLDLLKDILEQLKDVH
jgi:hypothetical protein